MSRFWRSRPALPSEIAEALQIGRRDRVLAWSELVGGGAAVALVSGLRTLTPRGQRIDRPWIDVDHANWDQDSAMLLVSWVDSRVPTPLELAGDDGSFPEAVRERVQSSVLLTVAVSLPDRTAGRVALRRDAEGRLSTQALLPPGLTDDDPLVREALAVAVESMWAEAGDDLRPEFSPDDRPPPIL